MALGPTALAATFTGIGAVILGLIIGLVIVILRARQTHKRMLADLEERGVFLAQSRQDTGGMSIVRPRPVLRRKKILPFNNISGWGTLSSVETISVQNSRPLPQNAALPNSTGAGKKPRRLSWPFSSRRTSGKAIHMRKLRMPVLSTVIESPKRSPLVPVLSGSLGGESPSPRRGRSRPSSDQSLLRRHPAFRGDDCIADSGSALERVHSDPLRRSLDAKAVTKTEVHVRPSRSKSVAEVSTSIQPGEMSRAPRPHRHAKSVSQTSGLAPHGGLPPLPLGVARVKSEAQRRSLLSQSPSRCSISSFESAGSSILATQSSPIMRSPNTRIQKITKRHTRGSVLVGPRPIRDTLTLHGKSQPLRGSMNSSAARYSLATLSAQDDGRSSILTKTSSLKSVGNLSAAGSMNLTRIMSSSDSPVTLRSKTTPKRKSGSHVTPYGSPEERRKRSSTPQDATGNQGGPKRQLSQASTQASSTRSSNGNPFQWDPSPMSLSKPSNLKGSPSARNRGHRRQNCVRISLNPIVHWPRSRSPSPAAIEEVIEESPGTGSENCRRIGLGFSSTRSLPRPPSTSIFAPDLKLTTSIRASLTPSSPTLHVANFDHGPVGSPIVNRNYYVPSGSPWNEQKNRSSGGTVFSLPSFPMPCHNTMPPPPIVSISRPSNEYDDDERRPDVAVGASSSFEMLIDNDSSPIRPLLTVEYDPEHPSFVSETPPRNLPRNFSSSFSAIPEESSAQSNRTLNYEQLRFEDSPPCSPKTVPQQSPFSVFRLSLDQTVIPEEQLDTIDPALLNKQAFQSLNTPFDRKSNTILGQADSKRKSIPIPTNPISARSIVEPLLEAAFPSSPPVPREFPLAGSTKRDSSATQPGYSNAIFSCQSSPGSTYSSSPSPIPPSSPRPAPALDFAAMPTLTPSLCGPRASPPRPLSSSIHKLRRMNSDAEESGKTRAGRGERQYLRLGRRRQDSVTLRGEESWLDEVESVVNEAASVAEEEEDSTWDEEKGKILIGNILNDWEEEATVLDLQDASSANLPTAPSPTLSITKSTGEDLSMWVHTPTGTPANSSPKPSTPTTNRDRSSSIWEDGEKFWCSTPPLPPTAVTSPNKPKQRFMPLSSSPVAVSAVKANKKREFEVAKDDSPAQNDGNGKETEKRSAGRPSSQCRKRSALGVGTPNVRIHVHPPSSGNLGTPGSLYDAEGFLRM